MNGRRALTGIDHDPGLSKTAKDIDARRERHHRTLLQGSRVYAGADGAVGRHGFRTGSDAVLERDEDGLCSRLDARVAALVRWVVHRAPRDRHTAPSQPNDAFDTMTDAARTPSPPSSDGPRAVDQRVRELIADQLLRGRSKAAVLDSLVELGHDAWAVRGAIMRMVEEPAFKAAQRLQQERLKLESVAANLQRLWELAPGYGSVEKRPTPSRDEFFERYVVGCRPVVLTDAARDWPALTRWSPAWLKERFGALQVQVQDGRDANPNYEQDRDAHRHTTTMAAFVDRVLAGGPSNDYYLTANNDLLRQPEFAPLLGDIGTLPPICERALLPRLSNFWFGPAGTVSPLHHDRMMLFHTQVVGRKRWRLISPLETPRVYNRLRVFSEVDIDAPDLERHPLFGLIGKVLDVVVEPGETMFLPLGWWHHVNSLDVSLSFGYWNLDLPQQFEYHDPGVYDFGD